MLFILSTVRSTLFIVHLFSTNLLMSALLRHHCDQTIFTDGDKKDSDGSSRPFYVLTSARLIRIHAAIGDSDIGVRQGQ